MHFKIPVWKLIFGLVFVSLVAMQAGFLIGEYVSMKNKVDIAVFGLKCNNLLIRNDGIYANFPGESLRFIRAHSKEEDTVSKLCN